MTAKLITHYIAGPWEVFKWQDGSNLEGQANIRAPESEVVIAADVMEAEAHLMAAAPDLLEALEDMTGRFIRCCEYNDSATPELLAESVKDAKAAIAKARGES